MSTSSAPIAAARVGAAAPKVVPSPASPRLRVVPPPRRRRSPRTPFVLLVVGLLAGGLLGLLMLNTVLAQDAFVLHDLRTQSSALSDREDALVQQVAAREAPGALAARARALGMVPNPNPAFIRLSDGTVLGKPAPATAPPAPPATTPSKAPQSTAQSKATTSKGSTSKVTASKVTASKAQATTTNAKTTQTKTTQSKTTQPKASASTGSGR